VVQAVAVGEVVLTRKEKEDGIIVIDVGAGTTDIGVYGGGSLVHTSVIPMGGSDLTRDISLGLKLSLDEAEKLKLDYGTLFRSVTDQAPPIILKVMGGQETRKISVSTVTDIIEARVQEIIDQCKDQLLKAELGDIIPKAIVLTGGTSHLKGFPEYLARTMRVPVQIGMPHLPNGYIQGLDNPESAAAVGLLRYGIRQRFHVSRPLVRSDELNPGNGNFLSKIRRMWQDFLH
jgi:cell division protein FtsA